MIRVRRLTGWFQCCRISIILIMISIYVLRGRWQFSSMVICRTIFGGNLFPVWRWWYNTMLNIQTSNEVFNEQNLPAKGIELSKTISRKREEEDVHPDYQYECFRAWFGSLIMHTDCLSSPTKADASQLSKFSTPEATNNRSVLSGTRATWKKELVVKFRNRPIIGLQKIIWDL